MNIMDSYQDSREFDELFQSFGISKAAAESVSQAEAASEERFRRIEQVRSYNQYKVIKAMRDCKVSETMFAGSTGYGYDDRGRDVLEQVYARCFDAEAALVRSQITCGTQAISMCLFGILRPGQTLLAATGKPYDTLDEVIGIRGEGHGSLRDFGIGYKAVDLVRDTGKIDIDGVLSAIDETTGLVLIQRSSGYSDRAGLSVEEIGQACAALKAKFPELPVMVDNCYGEFVDTKEPTAVGADIMAGSLIKNPGGGIAPTGGYVAGRRKYVEMAADRMTAPGLGGHVGPSLGFNRLIYQGLFFAPHVVGESLKGAVLCAELMERMGYETLPSSDAKRNDIIQIIRFGDERAMIEFCKGIQSGSAVDSYVEPEPCSMPGYDSPVIMAAGAFIQGSSIELSADGPVRPPYTVYMQGGLVYESVRLGLMKAITNMYERDK